MSETLLREVKLLQKNIQKKDIQIKEIILDKEEKIQEQKNQVERLMIKTQELKNAYEAEVEKRCALQRLIFGKKSEKFVEVIEGQDSLVSVTK
jgi:hypothetical protein